jgi:hypothetical protein
MIPKIREDLERFEVLTGIYNDLCSRSYFSIEDRDIAKLKMKLIKKELLLLSYTINKELTSIC